MTRIHTFIDLDEIFSRYCRDRQAIDIGGMSGNADHVFPLEKLKRYTNSIVCVDANRNDRIDLTAIEFHQAKIQDFDTERRFEIVFCGEIIEHIADQESFLLKVRSLLTDEGRVIVTTPNSTALSDFYRVALWGRDPRQDAIYERKGGVFVSGHVLIRNIATLQQLFDSVGMTITDVFYHRPVGGNFVKQFVRDAILKWRPHFSSQIVVVAEKSRAN